MAKTSVLILLFVLLTRPALPEKQDEINALGPALDKAQTGDPAGAVRAALEVTRKDPQNVMAWYLCGMLRFYELSEYAGAIECLDPIVILVSRKEREFSEMRHVYRGRGMSHYMLGEFAKAEADLRVGIGLEPDTVHGHLLWFLAAGRAGSDGKPTLRKYDDDQRSDEWPHPLVALYLGDATAEETLAAAVVANEWTTRGNLCEAHYYLGELYLLRGDETLALEQFESVLQTGMEKYNEYRMAREELARLGKP